MSMSLKKKIRKFAGGDTTYGSKITTLETTVGDSKKGLVKDLADLTARVKALEDAK